MNSGKSHMRSNRDDEALLVQFLLGSLPEEEQVQVEDRAFADPDYMGLVEAVEADLIDAFVCGELPPVDRRAFEARFMTSPPRLRKVEFARALARVTTELKSAEPLHAARRSSWPSLLSLMRGWSPAFQFAAGVAALVVLTAVSTLLVQYAAMRSRVTVLEAQSRDAANREQSLRRELSTQSQRPPANETASTSAPAIASLILMPGLTRAEASREQLVLSPDVPIVRIAIQLEPRDEFSRFRAELRTRAGEELLTYTNLRRRHADGASVVSFDVPSSALAAGEYELGLKGVTPNQPEADIGYYYFAVHQK
jgi:hypothetical protein